MSWINYENFKAYFFKYFFFYLYFHLIFIIPYTYKFFNLFQSIQVSGKNFDQRSILPNYNNIDWSSIHFDEISKLKLIITILLDGEDMILMEKQ